MNLYELRNSLYVTNYYSHSDGANIKYVLKGKSGSISLTKDVLINELRSIGSLDEEIEWDTFEDYSLSQWDALNIAIRFEQAREINKELENSDIFNALANITKPSNE